MNLKKDEKLMAMLIHTNLVKEDTGYWLPYREEKSGEHSYLVDCLFSSIP